MGCTILLLCHGTGRGGQWGRRLQGTASLLWRLVLALTEHVRGRGRNKRKKTKKFSSPTARLGKEEEETMSSQNGTILFFVFWKMHETTSFFPKHVVSFKWKLLPKASDFKSVLQLARFSI